MARLKLRRTQRRTVFAFKFLCRKKPHMYNQRGNLCVRGSPGHRRGDDALSEGTRGSKRRVQSCSERSHLLRNPQATGPMNPNSLSSWLRRRYSICRFLLSCCWYKDVDSPSSRFRDDSTQRTSRSAEPTVKRQLRMSLGRGGPSLCPQTCPWCPHSLPPPVSYGTHTELRILLKARATTNRSNGR